LTRPIDLIEGLSGRGIQISVDGDDLRLRVPKGVLTTSDRNILILYKNEILSILREATLPPIPPVRRRKTTPPAPGGGRVEMLAQNPHNPPNRVATPAFGDSADCADIAGARPALVSKKGRTRGTPPAAGQQAIIGGKSYRYFFYSGEELVGETIAFDTETALIQGNEVPDLALASASTGREHCLIHPDRVGEFVRRHRDRHLVLHNCSFDYWVVSEHLERRHDLESLEVWARFVDEGRMHDTMLLDGLIRLARTDAYPRPRDLAEVALAYAGLAIDKCDPYRLRYGEILGVDWAKVEPAFFEYAVKDAIVTLAAYEAMLPIAIKLMEDHGDDPSRRN
jgi:hypothetical protein